MAYIYYITVSQPQSFQSQEQRQDTLTPPPAESIIEEALLNDALTHNTRLLESFEAGTKAYMQFDIQDIRSIKYQVEERNHESKEREKRMIKVLEEFAQSRLEMERQMKEWREEQLRMIWGGKQRREGFGGWFSFGSPRVTEGVARGEGLRDSELNRKVVDSDVKERFD